MGGWEAHFIKSKGTILKNPTKLEENNNSLV